MGRGQKRAVPKSDLGFKSSVQKIAKAASISGEITGNDLVLVQ
jgi:hypothetical protein